MKKILIITALIATGLTAYAQTLVLSDSFTNTLGVATNDLNLNLGVRQAGTAAPINYTTSTNTALHSLTAAGKLNVKATAGQWDSFDADPIGSQIGSDSFSIKWKAAHAPTSPDGNWSMFMLLSGAAGNWDNSPMSINLWSMGYVHLDYGTTNDTLASTNLRVDMDPARVASAIGAAYDADDEHDFEIRTIANNASSGTWGFYIDGVNVAAGLPYDFEDAAKTMRWNANDKTDVDWDDLEVSTIAVAPAKEYVFFDNFDSADHDDMGWLYGVRQTNGTVVSSFGPHHSDYSITNVAGSGKLNNYATAKFANMDVDLSSHIEGQNFELGCKVAINIPDETWTSFHLFDNDNAAAGGDTRGDSRLGMHIPGASEPWACIVYFGAGAAQESLGIDPSWYPALAGYDKADEHEFRFVSTAGTGGTNSFELFIDGVEIFDGVTAGLPDSQPYYFNGNQLRIGIVGVMATDKTKGALYDDIYLKVFPKLTYEQWAEDKGLTEGVNDARTDNPDSDSMDNLLEYALGGDPLVDDDAAILPVLQFPDAATMEYIYRRRNDAAARGLVYDFKTKDDLVVDSWTSRGDSETGTNAVSAEIDEITNSVDITEDSEMFLNLEVTEQ